MSTNYHMKLIYKEDLFSRTSIILEYWSNTDNTSLTSSLFTIQSDNHLKRLQLSTVVGVILLLAIKIYMKGHIIKDWQLKDQGQWSLKSYTRSYDLATAMTEIGSQTTTLSAGDRSGGSNKIFFLVDPIRLFVVTTIDNLLWLGGSWTARRYRSDWTNDFSTVPRSRNSFHVVASLFLSLHYSQTTHLKEEGMISTSSYKVTLSFLLL